jgi:pimeloyl-ACP methyl ester carboxylesterase
MNISRTVRILTVALLVIGATTTQNALAQATTPRTVMWLHGKGEERQGYWNRFASDILSSRGRIDTLFELDYRGSGGYDSPRNISLTAEYIYRGIGFTSSFLGLQRFIDPIDRAKNPILIGHSQGGITAREIDRQFSNSIGGIITVGSPNHGVGLLAARAQVADAFRNKNAIEVATERGIIDMVRALSYDPIWAGASLGYLGGQFISLEMCNRAGNEGFLNQLAGVVSGLGYGLFGSLAGFVTKAIFIAGDIGRLWFTVGSFGTITSPVLEEWVLLSMPALATSVYGGLSQNLLGTSSSTGLLQASVSQMAPASLAAALAVPPNTPTLIPLLNNNPSTTPRAGIYGTARFISPVRLLSNQMGRAKTDEYFPCRLPPTEPMFPIFARQLPEAQDFLKPDDTRLLTYINRTRDIYITGRDINNGFGYITFVGQALIDLLDLTPTSWQIANAWDQGREFLDHGLQNQYSYLNGATRVVNTTQRRTIIGYRCQGFRGLSPTPQGTNCEMEITEVDEPISYIVSTGDDGFIAENDQKIPLRPNRVIPFEDNFQAGDPNDPIVENQKSCNHFIEGNHPAVYRRLRFLLVENSDSPFFVQP